MTSESESLHVFFRDGIVFSSPNSPLLPTIPPFQVFHDGFEPDPEDVGDLCWASNRFPQIGFLPASPHFHGPIFQRLNHVNITPR
jgi:hypothetical protein